MNFSSSPKKCIEPPLSFFLLKKNKLNLIWTISIWYKIVFNYNKTKKKDRDNLPKAKVFNYKTTIFLNNLTTYNLKRNK